MSTDRLDELARMLVEEPGDLFLRYAIALERKRIGDMDQAIADLGSILTDDAKYIPAYYQLALLKADLGHLDEARTICEAGALQCIVTGDRKARVELQQLGASLNEDE
ncbi:MAG: tetratricopeptide repeat protein [Flavobacteriales bacterium]|nr:tetratricopeptide repeat protein [Flavobacteriales bacterium]